MQVRLPLKFAIWNQHYKNENYVLFTNEGTKEP
jgi:hypothetical protein